MADDKRRIPVNLIPLAQSAGEDLRRKLETKGILVTMLAVAQVPLLEKNDEHTIFVIIKDGAQKLPQIVSLDKPMLLISDRHEKELEAFEKIFVPTLGLPKSSSLSNILDALSVLDEMSFKKREKEEADRAAEALVVEKPVEEALPVHTHHDITDLEEPAAALGRYLVSLKKMGPLGGFSYASMHKIERPLTPTRFVIIDTVVSDSLDNLGRWQRAHTLRVAAMAPLLAAPVIDDRKLLDEIMLAALLTPKALQKEHSSLLRRDYTGRGCTLARKELASLIKDSALQMSSVVGAERITSLIAMTARYIGREQPLEDSSLGIAASALVAADCIDRLVFFTGFFRPEPAHRIIRGITSGKLKDFHPAISCNLLKFLAEAMSAVKIVEKKDAPVEELLESELSVKLHDLIPGMRLSRPLNAADGKALVAADVELDEDLILRIWQLSTLRSIRPAVVLHV